jgi:hypothetical protein
MDFLGHHLGAPHGRPLPEMTPPDKLKPSGSLPVVDAERRQRVRWQNFKINLVVEYLIYSDTLI